MGEEFERKLKNITQEVRVCRECPVKSGELCINDYNKASYDEQCGSGVRDSLGICRPKNTLEQQVRETQKQQNIFYDPWIIAIGGTIISALILAYVFGIGKSSK